MLFKTVRSNGANTVAEPRIAAAPAPVRLDVHGQLVRQVRDRVVADLRAPTPSAAAELAVADGAELLERLAQFRRRMERPLREKVARARLALDAVQPRCRHRRRGQVGIGAGVGQP